MRSTRRLMTYAPKSSVLTLLTVGWLLTGVACSTAKKTKPELSDLEGRKVALIDVEGESTSRKVAEVALINQLMKRGSFVLIPKEDVEKARLAPTQDPTDWQGIARRAGAEVALRMKILQFDADTREGYSSEEVKDEILAKERGDDGKAERLYKVKAMDGTVKVEVQYADLRKDPPDVRTGIAQASDKVQAEARTTSAHLPPKLRFLENLANEAFAKFFEQYK